MTEESLFQEALTRPPEERAAFLDAACAGRPQLRAAVAALLAAAEKPGNVLDGRPAGPGPTPASPPQEGADAADAALADPATAEHRPDTRPGVIIVGRYVLQEKIGEGGMGEVWVAKQTEPVKRKVALKLIKAGMDSRAVLARFEQERQALALMDHPHIARVLDGGLAPDRRPFFVMELVNGLPLTRFCDEARLGIRERLELFAAVCQAVQHAHQKGVVHRDLKPSNILVTVIDGRPVPKVIDFGVAKATAGKLTEESLSTHFGAVVGTLEYMAPEQAGYAGADIDTRADIYSLGVILYELLTGLRPLDARRLKQAAFAEVLRIIKEEDPSRPSTRLSTDASAPSLAALRQSEPRKLAALLRGELDWVVMRCLEKRRDRRYETANGLARDVQRYLAHEVVEARPPSAGYRLGKFLRRRRGPAAAVGLVFAALLVGIAGTTFGLLRAEQRRQEADQARADEAEQRRLADANAAIARQAAAAETAAKEREAVQRALAERARDRTRDALDAMTSAVTGDSLTTQKELSDEQKQFLREVLTYYREFAGEKADDESSRVRTAAAAHRVGFIEYRLGRKEEAAAAMRLAHDGFAKLAADFPPVPAYHYELAGSHNNLGAVLAALGRRPEAEQHYHQALALWEKLAAGAPAVADYRRQLAASHNNLGVLLAAQGKGPEAERQYRQALALREKLAADAPAVPLYQADLAGSHNSLGILLAGLGQRAEAERQFRQALALLAKLAADTPAVPDYRQELANSHNNLGILLKDLGQRAEAERQYRQALALQEKLAAEFPAAPYYRQQLASSHHNLGVLLVLLGKGPEAEGQLRQALALRAKLAADAPAVAESRQDQARSHHALGGVLARLGKVSEAEAQYRQALTIQEKLVADAPAVPVNRRDLAASLCNLGLLLAGLGKGPEAEERVRQALTIQEKLAADFPAVPQYQMDLGCDLLNLGNLIHGGGRPGDSLDWYAKAIRTLTAVYERDRRSVLAKQYLRNSHAARAAANDGLHQFAAAVRDWDLAVALSPLPEQPGIRAARATARANAGQVAEAVAEVAELAKRPGWNAVRWYNFACVYALAGARIADKKQAYADRAMELLHQAVKAGWNDAAHMRQDTDLDSLRGRADFQELLAGLEKKTPDRPE